MLVDSEGSASHAVAIADDLYGRRVVMDHELADALPLSQEALDNCCGAGLTCDGLTEVVLVQAVGRKAYAVDERAKCDIPVEALMGIGTCPPGPAPQGRIHLREEA